MSVTYLTTIASGDQHQIIQKIHKNTEDGKIGFMTLRNPLINVPDPQNAELIARTISAAARVPFLPGNPTIIGSIRMDKTKYLAIEVTPDNHATGMGSVVERTQSIAEAKRVASERQLPFVEPMDPAPVIQLDIVQDLSSLLAQSE